MRCPNCHWGWLELCWTLAYVPYFWCMNACFATFEVDFVPGRMTKKGVE